MEANIAWITCLVSAVAFAGLWCLVRHRACVELVWLSLSDLWTIGRKPPKLRSKY